MKNLTYTPFKRNRYFNGKLLTAEDFEQEQRYMNDKRRLVNRWVMGMGVVAGLEIIRVDDYSISLEMGMAFDASGREIMVEDPAILKLSLLDGFEEATAQEGSETLYLCIEYAETPVEPVHNISYDNLHAAEDTEYGKYLEGYHLYVTDDEPVDTGEEMNVWDTEKCICERAERIGRGTWQRGVYLARVDLVKAGSFFMIDRIELVPFNQFVYSQPVMAGMVRRLGGGERGGNGVERSEAVGGGLGTEAEAGTSAEFPWQFEEGQAVIPVGRDGKAGKLFYSKEISHGLGLGNVQLMLRVAAGEYTYGGEAGVFPGEEPGAAAGFKLNRADGTFVIGIRLLKDCQESEITVGWTAIRSRVHNEVLSFERRLFIRPAMVNLKVREDFMLNVVFVNMESKKVLWKVLDSQGGSIEENGWYHAPNRPGVYQVEAESQAYPELRASVFIIVRE